MAFSVDSDAASGKRTVSKKSLATVAKQTSGNRYSENPMHENKIEMKLRATLKIYEWQSRVESTRRNVI